MNLLLMGRVLIDAVDNGEEENERFRCGEKMNPYSGVMLVQAGSE